MEETCLHTDGSTVQIGDRLECEGHFATVRYIGLVPPTKGLWLGVEWDDSSRGKHDGTHEGHTYFKTIHPTAGSFLRPKKANFGVTFMSAVRDRYGKIDDENAGVIPDDLFVVGPGNKQTVVEMVGAKKINERQSKLDTLQEVVLTGMLVFGSPLSDTLSQMVPSIVDLDITRCLLPTWASVAQIVQQLKCLKSLNVSENKLTLPENVNELAPCFCHVRNLFLNKMSLSWKQILQISEMFSGLHQIHACFNNIETLSELEGRLHNVRLVNLESNNITDWTQMFSLSKLPFLERIILSNNGISKIFFDEGNGTSSTDMFQALTTLTITHNKIDEWTSINELNKLKHLEELRMNFNALMETATPETVRQLLVAKLKHLKRCNRTVVEGDERKGAEIDYLKRFGPDWIKAGGNQDPNKNKPSAEFLTLHPRFNDLIQIWGAPEDSEMKQQSTTLKSSLIPVKIVCPSKPDVTPIEKKVPGTMTVQKLKALIHRLMKLDTDMELSYISQKMNGQEIELDGDQRSLSFYSVEPGDTIHVKL